MKKILFFALLCFLSYSYATNPYADFPLRRQYLELNYLSSNQVFNLKDRATIVDVRPKEIYDFLHISKAHNIPFFGKDKKMDIDFPNKIIALARKTRKPLVFYCFGYDCFLSYKAARITQRLGLLNAIYVFDGGMYEWAINYPTLTEPSKNVKEYIQLQQEIQSHSLPIETFIQRSLDPDVIILNLSRSTDFNPFSLRSQRLLIKKEKERFDAIIQQARAQRKTLLLFAQSSRVYIEPMQYLTEKNFKDFHFMAGGIFEYNEMLLKEFYNNKNK